MMSPTLPALWGRCRGRGVRRSAADTAFVHMCPDRIYERLTRQVVKRLWCAKCARCVRSQIRVRHEPP